MTHIFEVRIFLSPIFLGLTWCFFQHQLALTDTVQTRALQANVFCFHPPGRRADSHQSKGEPLAGTRDTFSKVSSGDAEGTSPQIKGHSLPLQYSPMWGAGKRSPSRGGPQPRIIFQGPPCLTFLCARASAWFWNARVPPCGTLVWNCFSLKATAVIFPTPSLLFPLLVSFALWH